MKTPSSARVFIIDNQPLMAAGIKAVLENAGFDVVGSSTDGNDGVEQCKLLKADICILDTSLSGLAAQLINKELSDLGVKVVGTVNVPDAAHLQTVLDTGALALVLKTEPVDVLCAATRAAAESTTFVSEPVERLLALHDPQRETFSSEVRPLTPRELEVLKLFADGNSTSEIATKLSLSVKTVETHRKNVMDKLQTRSIAQLTKLAIQSGISSLAN